jgi:beta-lactam-binding protein with PASTA domain
VGVSGGTWSASVALQPGVNLVDVLASAGRARPALTVVRVRRLIEVRVPDLAGATVDQARQRLADVGLKARFQDTGGGFFDQLLGGTPQVCDTTPPAGRQVDPGATVQVTVGRRC